MNTEMKSRFSENSEENYDQEPVPTPTMKSLTCAPAIQSSQCFKENLDPGSAPIPLMAPATSQNTSITTHWTQDNKKSPNQNLDPITPPTPHSTRKNKRRTTKGSTTEPPSHPMPLTVPLSPLTFLTAPLIHQDETRPEVSIGRSSN